MLCGCVFVHGVCVLAPISVQAGLGALSSLKVSQHLGLCILEAKCGFSASGSSLVPVSPGPQLLQ